MLSPKATKAAIVCVFVIMAVLVIVQWNTPAPKPEVIYQPCESQRNEPSTTPLSSFLRSLDKYYEVNPKKLHYFPSFTFIRYEYPAPLGHSVFLTQPHYEWVTKYENHVVPVFEKQVFGKKDCLVVDIGANDGVYTQLSAGAGCSVVAFEMQDGCFEWIVAGVLFNNVNDRVRLIPHPAYFEETTIVSLHQPGVCSGTYSLSPNSVNNKPTGESVAFKTVVIQNLIPTNLTVTLLKVDVEGQDVGVVKGALEMFKQHRIQHLVAEIYAAMWPEPYSAGMRLELGSTHPLAGLAVYHEILKAGYVAQCLGKYHYGNFPTVEIEAKPIFTYETRSEFDGLVKAQKNCIDWHFYLPSD